MKQGHLTLILACVLSFNTLASDNQDESEFSAEPLSETDMDQVSLDAGLNVLNVYGATEAGLTVDNDSTTELGIEDTESNDDNETTANLHTQDELKKIVSQDGLGTNNDNTDQRPNDDALQAAVEETQTEVGNAEVFTTSSEIKYKKNKFKHKLSKQNLQEGSVTITRDMHIDLLKLENLAGDHNDQTRTAGDIYLSDWSSRGDTTITPR